MIFPQQASSLLTSMRQRTKPLPTPSNSRMALGQVSIRPQPLHLLSVCLQNSLQIDPVSLNDSPLGRWIIRRATGQKARHITPKCPATGTKLSQSEMKLRILPAQDCEQESESTEVPISAVCEWVEGVLQPFASRCWCR